MIKLKEIGPEDCRAAFENRKKELEILASNQKLEIESKIDGWIKELIIDCQKNLEKGIVPFSCFHIRKEVIQAVADYYRERGWSCQMQFLHTMSLGEYHLKIDFPGPMLRIWQRIKNFFFQFFSQSKKSLPPKTVYRD